MHSARFMPASLMALLATLGCLPLGAVHGQWRQSGCCTVPTYRPAPCTTAMPAVPPSNETGPPPKKVDETPSIPVPPEALAQPSAEPESSMGTGETLTLFDSSVGYINNAIPGGQFRLRFDSAYDNNRATRAEFFYARTINPGLPFRETRVDYQELSAYIEVPVATQFSGFVEVGTRFLNPEVNANTAGMGDMNFGFKWAFQACEDRVTTFQLRTYVPTGDADRGLGNNHVTVEPGLLSFRRLSDQLRLETELRYWQPIGGTDFAGSVLRYGVGLSYGERCPEGAWIAPVAEVVGWTVLYGKETVVQSPTAVAIQDAAGDTIVNFKIGVRAGMGDRADLYLGYGRPLTGEVWYENVYRLEFRLFF